jgi:hypothetical protein
MSQARTVKAGVAGAAALFMLSACVSPDGVSALESQANAAEARASQFEAAANQCTATCQGAEARVQRM